jgi:benzil reductase ((S)-benzoin forming)
MKYFIITGASRGLGQALAKKCITDKNKVFCVSRTMNHGLRELASLYHTGFWYFEQDLTDLEKIPSLIHEIFTYIDPDKVEEITLINNAGIVEPVKPLGKCTFEEISDHITINYSAPAILSNEFIKESERFKCKKNIINISSGAAVKPYFGWTMYCSSKAALNMLTQAVGLEQSTVDFPVRILSIAPGVIDTDMQETIRNVDIKDFPMKPRFENLHEQNKLVDPDEAATQIIEVLNLDSLVNGSFNDLRDIRG